MSLAVRIAFEPLRSLAAASVVAGYTAVGTPLAHPARQIFLQNLTDQTVMFSFDGVNDAFPLPANGFFLDDITSNKSVSDAFYLAKGTQLYVKEVGNPATGSIYFASMYGLGE